MLTGSFACFKGLSISSEQKIWELGCHTWDQFDHLPHNTFSAPKMATVHSEIKQAKIALGAGMVDYFLNRFKYPDQIRVLHEFQHQSAIIDIETTGLKAIDEITTIALLKHGEISLFIKDINLPFFLKSLQDLKLLITFNGTRFDLPFIRKCFSIDLALPHLDLMPVLKQLGYSGGQKRCEELLHLKRHFSKGLTGHDASQLWNEWQNNQNHAALNQLIQYNIEDVFMLEKLSIKCYNMATRNYPFRPKLKSSTPDQPKASFNINGHDL